MHSPTCLLQNMLMIFQKKPSKSGKIQKNGRFHERIAVYKRLLKQWSSTYRVYIYDLQMLCHSCLCWISCFHSWHTLICVKDMSRLGEVTSTLSQKGMYNPVQTPICIIFLTELHSSKSPGDVSSFVPKLSGCAQPQLSLVVYPIVFHTFSTS